MNNFMYSRGNLVLSDDEGNSVYEDGTPFDDSRPCVACGVSCDPDAPDPCIGWLDGVDYSCCGHGVDEGYIMTGDKRFTMEEWHEIQMG